MSKRVSFSAPPCPRCGGKASGEKAEGTSQLGSPYYWETYTCKKCGLRMHGKQPDSALRFWRKQEEGNE